MKSFRTGITQYYHNQHKECQLIFEQCLSSMPMPNNAKKFIDFGEPKLAVPIHC